MKNPFKVGDKVYHARFGLIEIQAIYNRERLKAMVDGNLESVSIELLSFSPWPKPNHERPWEPSLNKGDVVFIRIGNGEIRGIEVMVEYEHYILCSGGVSYTKRQYQIFRTGEQIK